MVEYKNSFKIKNQGYKMSGFQPAITIKNALNSILKREYLIPDFQRDYTWGTEQIERLFDSIMKGYPISSMLFCKIEPKTTDWNFYQFLESYTEGYSRNTECNSNDRPFYAVLDGQQRLTSLNLALNKSGTYSTHKLRKRWEDKPENFEKRSFYFNLTQSQAPSQNLDVEYEFLWLENEKTNEDEIYIDKYEQKWFKCNCLDRYNDDNNNFDIEQAMDKNLTKEERQRLNKLHNKIYNAQIINYYLEDENSDKAVEIFIRINSGGTPLTFANILFSFTVANWKKGNFRELADKMLSNLPFKVNRDFILKAFLFLFHKEIRYQINSFNKDFVSEKIEKNWDKLAKCFEATFNLISRFGFDDKTLTGKLIVMPILYFIYHNNIENEIVDSIAQEKNRDLIKIWLLRAIACNAISIHSDNILSSMRKVFTDDIEKSFFKTSKYIDFPKDEIEKSLKYIRLSNDNDFFNEKLSLRKDNAETFTILSLLYPNLNSQLSFDKDHLHPFDSCKKIENLDVKEYDSIVNLQMLEKSLNRSKKNQPLEDWVKEKCGDNREKFLEEQLIPDVDLSIDNFTEFYEKRKQLLISKLKKVLGMKQDDETGDNK